jgi:5-methylcytosine-specific restriction endonuclease McrA
MMLEHPSHQGSSSELAPREQAWLDWHRAHAALSRLARSRARLDWEEGRLLLDALRSNAHLHLGFGSFGEYIERMLGHTRRATEERLRVAEALERSPGLANALRDGSLSWSAVRELTRVATASNEEAWLEVAKGRTLRQIEELVAGHSPGDMPNDSGDPSLRRHVLRFEVSAETYAAFREAMAKLRRESDSSLDDDASLLLVARQILGGPTDEGRAPYQIALTVCEECGRGRQQGRGELVEVGADVVETARCDAQHVGHTHVGAEPTKARQDITPALRRHVLRRDGGRCVVPGCRQSLFLDLHHVVLRSEGGEHSVDNLITVCGAHHRALHRGQLVIDGHSSSNLMFRHADGTPYGRIIDPRTTAAYEQAFHALRSLGFRECEARGALDTVRKESNACEPAFERILRQALAALTREN